MSGSAPRHPVRHLVIGAAIVLCGATAAVAADRPGEGAVRVRIETIAVDGNGTRSVGLDEADIFPGQGGTLEKTITLAARPGGDYPEEEVHLRTRVSLGDDDALACPLLLAIVATGSPRGGAPPPQVEPERRALSFPLMAGVTRMAQAYVSPFTGGRVALRITCGEAIPAAAPDGVRSFEFEISLERGEEDAVLHLLRADRLSTTLGREAGSLFSSNVPLPDDADGERRFRRERLDVRLAPQILSGGRLQVEVRLQGEIATISASGTERHPIDVNELLVLAGGETRDLEVTARASAEAEGWAQVRYRLRVTGRF